MIEAIADHAGMFAIFAASLLAGFALGLRFRVLVLVPALLVCMVVIAGIGVALRAGIWPTAIAIIITAFRLAISSASAQRLR